MRAMEKLLTNHHIPSFAAGNQQYMSFIMGDWNVFAESFEKDAVLLIGDPAIAFIQADRTHRIWDLGAAWKELTGLPFVFAVWAIRQGYEDPALLSSLMSAKLKGIAQLPALIEGESRFDPDFRKEYLGKTIQYDMGEREKTAIHCFMEKLAAGLDQKVYPPRFVYHEVPKK